MRSQKILLVLMLILVCGCNGVKHGDCFTAGQQVEGEGEIRMFIEVDDVVNGVVRYRMHAQANGKNVNIYGNQGVKEMGLEKFQDKIKSMERSSGCSGG